MNILKLILFFTLSINCYSQILKTDLDRKIFSIINKNIESNNIPGAVILIKKGDKILLKKAYGYAKLCEYDGSKSKNAEKMSINHSFDIASLTKVIGTTTAIMRLYDLGLIEINAPVSNYVKNFDRDGKENITIRQLLTHTSGMYEWYPLYYFSNSRQKTFEFIKKLPLKYKVGESRHYSDLGFTLLGELIENVSGMTLNEFLKKEIFKPLGMNSTTFNPDISKYKFAATSHGNPYEKRMVEDSTLGFKINSLDPNSWSNWRQYLLVGQVNDGNAWHASQGISGAAGLFSNVNDLQKLIDMMVNKGYHKGKQFISEKTISEFTAIDKYKNGLGWMMDPNNSFIKNAPEGSFGHTGFTGTSIAVIPSKKLSIIILINRQNIGLNAKREYFNVNPIRQEILEEVLKRH